MTVTAAQLIAQGASCSICGQGLSSANPPTISVANGVLYGGTPVDQAICTLSPYIERHIHDQSPTLFYQTAGNGFLTIMKKDLN